MNRGSSWCDASSAIDRADSALALSLVGVLLAATSLVDGSLGSLADDSFADRSPVDTVLIVCATASAFVLPVLGILFDASIIAATVRLDERTVNGPFRNNTGRDRRDSCDDYVAWKLMQGL